MSSLNSVCFSCSRKTLLYVCMVVFSILCAPNGFAAALTPGQYQLPGIVPSSLPAFETSVRVSLVKSAKGSTLRATYNPMACISNLVFPTASFSIKNTRYRLTAHFDDHNVFQGGSILIRGRIPGLVDGYGIKTLMTADLTSFAHNASGKLLGFNTANITCHPDIAAYAPCTTSESVFLSLKDGLFSNDFGHGKKWGEIHTTGLAITSIPIPAAAWLFGSGLLGLAGIACRKQKWIINKSMQI